MKLYFSKSRNKLIAKAFKEAGLIERYGTGIMRVRDICKNYGIKEPLFSENSNGFQVVIFKEKLNLTLTVVEKVVENITENQQNIINCIKLNPYMTAKEIAVKIEISHRKTQENIKKLQIMGLLNRIGPDKGGYWQVIDK